MWATYDIDTPSHERDRAEFALMDDLGLRASEIVELDVDDLRAEDHDLWVHGKGGKARLLPIEDDTLSVVEHYMECARPHLKCANRRQDATALFLNTEGELPGRPCGRAFPGMGKPPEWRICTLISSGGRSPRRCTAGTWT